MRFDVVLKGGRVFDPVHHVDERLDIGIREGRIAELEKELPHGEETYDVSGLTVIPGVIDMHVHVTKLLGGRVGYYMAAKTGVTTIIDYAGPVTDISSQISITRMRNERWLYRRSGFPERLDSRPPERRSEGFWSNP